MCFLMVTRKECSSDCKSSRDTELHSKPQSVSHEKVTLSETNKKPEIDLITAGLRVQIEFVAGVPSNIALKLNLYLWEEYELT